MSKVFTIDSVTVYETKKDRTYIKFEKLKKDGEYTLKFFPAYLQILNQKSNAENAEANKIIYVQMEKLEVDDKDPKTLRILVRNEKGISKWQQLRFANADRRKLAQEYIGNRARKELGDKNDNQQQKNNSVEEEGTINETYGVVHTSGVPENEIKDKQNKMYQDVESTEGNRTTDTNNNSLHETEVSNNKLENKRNNPYKKTESTVKNTNGVRNNVTAGELRVSKTDYFSRKNRSPADKSESETVTQAKTRSLKKFFHTLVNRINTGSKEGKASTEENNTSGKITADFHENRGPNNEVEDTIRCIQQTTDSNEANILKSKKKDTFYENRVAKNKQEYKGKNLYKNTKQAEENGTMDMNNNSFYEKSVPEKALNSTMNRSTVDNTNNIIAIESRTSSFKNLHSKEKSDQNSEMKTKDTSVINCNTRSNQVYCSGCKHQLKIFQNRDILDYDSENDFDSSDEISTIYEHYDRRRPFFTSTHVDDFDAYSDNTREYLDECHCQQFFDDYSSSSEEPIFRHPAVPRSLPYDHFLLRRKY